MKSFYPTMSDRLRLFIALWLPEGLKKAALARLEELRPGSRGVRWIRPDQMHLTLKFLGETPADRLPALEEALARIAAPSRSITIRLTSGGTFPSSGPPRVLWLGVEPEQELSALAARVEEALAPLGFPEERRPYRPHLTLGRAEPGATFRREQLEKRLEAPPETVAALSLVQSELRPGGAVYTTVREWEMSNTGPIS